MEPTVGAPQSYKKQNSFEYNRDMSPSECVVSGALALALLIARCAGVAPLSVRAVRSGWCIAVSPSLAVLQRILITVLNTILLAALVLDISQDRDRRIRIGETGVTACVWIFDLVLVMTIASLALYSGSARTENLIRAMKQMQQINIDLNNEQCHKTKRIGVIAVVSLTIWAIATQVGESYMKIQCFMASDYNWSILVMYNAYYVAYTQGMIALMLWSCSAAEVGATAATLNNHLRRLLHECELTPDGPHVQSMIHRLALSHERTGDVIKQMNAGSGVFIMVFLMSNFVHLVITPYYLLRELNSDKVLAKVLVQLGWIVMHISTLLLVVEPCHWTQEQRETTKYLLSRLTVRLAYSPQLLRELGQFTKQIMLAGIKFAPLGVHTLGRPYMAAMLGGVATYLVILLQFQFQQLADHQ